MIIEVGLQPVASADRACGGMRRDGCARRPRSAPAPCGAVGDAKRSTPGSVLLAPLFVTGTVDGASRLNQAVVASGQRVQVRP